tara:strand:+ start:437 stop:1306 length:870 start_codon:yes stop_codon:yes gene_type:complete
VIIWLASYPKSGNTWLRIILHRIFIKNNNLQDTWLSNLSKSVDTYPRIKHFHNLNSLLVKENDFQNRNEIIKNWNKSQKKLNSDKKLRLLKTHNMLCSLNIDQHNHNFTDENNTLGVIHVVRDPRNVITSLKNHFFLQSYDEALKIIINENIWGGMRNGEIPHFISSWEHHFESWNLFPKNYILFKYEDILNNPKKQTKRLIEYLQKFIKIDLDEQIIDQTIKDTEFENLKSLEKKGHFLEAAVNIKTKNKAAFFNLGQKNDYRKLLDKEIQFEIEKKFKNTMKKLNYL